MHVLQLVTNERAPFFRQQLDALASRGIESTVRSPAGRHSSTSSRSARAYGRVALETLREDSTQYDLIHANYGLMGPVALLDRQLPTVLSLWGSDLLGRTGPLSRLCARLADEAIVMTAAMADELGQACHVIPHGIDLETFRPIPRATARQEVGWDADARHVLFPYGPDREIKAFPTAARVTARVRDRLAEPVTLQTVSDVDHDRMPYYYNAADALLLTSRREGSPNVVREALACNTPVVATDVGDVSRWLASVSPSAVCRSEQELTDALALVLETDERPAGRGHVAACTTAEMGAQLERVYERALARDGEEPVAVGAVDPEV